MIFLLLCFSVFACADAQTPPSEITAAAPVAEPALPTDPTAPSTVGPPAAASIPLIPSQPLTPLDVPPFPAAPSNPTASPAPFPTASPAFPATGPIDPLATPVASPPPKTAATTTDNIGTARRFQYGFALTLGTTFDDNIFLEPSSAARSDLYFTIQPSVTLGFGGGAGGSGQDNSIRLRYSPQALLYVGHPDLDTVQHFVNLSGLYHFSRLTLTASQDVQILDSTDVGNPHPFGQAAVTPPTGTTGGSSAGTGVNNAPTSSVNLDVGQRSRLNLYTSSVQANYYVSDKVTYDLNGQFAASEYAGDLLSTRTLSGSGFFNYSPTGKTTLGLGGTLGYVFAERPNPDQIFEQANLRLSYVPSAKLVAAGQVGLEFRQSSADDGTQFTPVFDLSVSYSPFDGTSVSLVGNRQVLTSAVFGGQDYTVTGFTIGVSQRFFQRVFTRLNVGYSHTDYISQVANSTADRTEDYFFVQPSLDYNFRENVVAGLYYNHRSSTSSQQIRSFDDNQIGVRLSLSF